jgi:hypothetical protein
MQNNSPNLILRHYSRTKPINCDIVSGDVNNFFTAKIKDPIDLDNEIVKGDPVIFGIKVDDDIKITGGSIIAFTDETKNITISPDKSFAVVERRQYERFPVSLYGYIKQFETNDRKCCAYIKDISYNGFRIYSEAELNPGENIELDINFEHSVFSVNGVVLRKTTCYGRNEYGIQMIFTNKNSIYTIKENIDRLLFSEKEIIMRHLLL